MILNKSSINHNTCIDMSYFIISCPCSWPSFILVYHHSPSRGVEYCVAHILIWRLSLWVIMFLLAAHKSIEFSGQWLTHTHYLECAHVNLIGIYMCIYYTDTSVNTLQCPPPIIIISKMFSSTKPFLGKQNSIRHDKVA